MAVKQGDKKKVNTGVKIDPDVLIDAKAWAAMNNSNFSAMVELLVKTVIDRDREAIERFKKLPKNSLGEAFETLFKKSTTVPTKKAAKKKS